MTIHYKVFLKITGLLLMVGLTFVLLNRVISYFPLFDFLEYWTSGFLNRTGGNPYGLNELFNLQKEMGWQYDRPLLAWTPPWALSLMMLLSYLPYDYSRGLWLFFSILAILIAAEKTWQLYGGERKYRIYALFAAFAFSPVFFNLMFGQITSLVLLGIIGFLIYVKRKPGNSSHGIIAGVCLSAIAIKPQLLYLVLAALLLWSLSRKSWSILTGFVLAILASSFITWIFNKAVFQQYLTALLQYPPNYWATPTLGYYLRILFGLKYFWLQFLPILPGLAWLGLYWVKNRAGWDWQIDLPVILLVSIVTSSFTWVHDQIILVPVIILIWLWVTQTRLTWLPATILLLLSSASLAYFILHFRWDDSVFVWTAPLLLLSFLPAHSWLKRSYLIS